MPTLTIMAMAVASAVTTTDVRARDARLRPARGKQTFRAANSFRRGAPQESVHRGHEHRSQERSGAPRSATWRHSPKTGRPSIGRQRGRDHANKGRSNAAIMTVAPEMQARLMLHAIPVPWLRPAPCAASRAGHQRGDKRHPVPASNGYETAAARSA